MQYKDGNDFLKDKERGGISASGIGSGLSTMLALLSVILTAALIFTEISFGDILSVGFMSEGVILMFVFWMMYLSMNENGIKTGKLDGRYLSSREEYLKKRSIIRERDRSLLNDFCRCYKESELERARSAILARRGIDYYEFKRVFLPISDAILYKREPFSDAERADLELYRKFSFPRRRAIKKALKLKPVKLYPEMLMCENSARSSRRPIPMSIDDAKRHRNAVGMLSIAFTTLLVVSIAVDIVIAPDKSAVIYGLIKILSLVFTGAKGYRSGVLLYTDDAVEFHESRIDILSSFEEWKREFSAKEGCFSDS